MQDLNDFAGLSVVDHGGFAAAGERLTSRNQTQPPHCATRGAVGRAFDSANHPSVRGHRGRQTFYQHCKAMLIEAERRSRRSRRCAPSRAVASGSPVRSPCCMSISDRCWRDLWRAIRVTLHLEATNRRVDVVGEGIDVAIRVRPRPIEDSDR